MGRPRIHDEQTATDLLRAAEELIEAGGIASLSMRALADRVGTTTRAIYSAVGSKDELLARLAGRAFELLGEEVAALPRTDDPHEDLIEAGLAFRAFARKRHALYQLAFNSDLPAPVKWPAARPAQQSALAELRSRLSRVVDPAAVPQAMVAFHAMCEGLAALENRGVLEKSTAADSWRAALSSTVRGLAGEGLAVQQIGPRG